MFRLCESLTARGYRRIGYAIEKHRDARVYHLWSAAFDRFQRDLPTKQRTIRYEGPHETGTFRSWLLATRPDVVFDCEEKTWSTLKTLRGSLSVKPDFALLGVTSEEGGF